MFSAGILLEIVGLCSLSYIVWFGRTNLREGRFYIFGVGGFFCLIMGALLLCVTLFPSP